MQKHSTDSTLEAEPSDKRKKSTSGVGSSASGLTHVNRQAGKRDEPLLDYEKFAKVQTEYWKECEGCYIFG